MLNMMNVHKSGRRHVLCFSATERPNCKLKIVQSNIFVQKRKQNLAEWGILSFIIVYAYKQYYEYCIKLSDYGSSSESNVSVSVRSIFYAPKMRLWCHR